MADNYDFGMMNRFETNAARERLTETRNAKGKNGVGGAGGGSWMLALAKTLGQMADKMGERIAEKATEIDAATDAKFSESKIPGNNGQSSSHGIAELNAELQVQTQLFSMFMGSVSNLIKSVGESAKTVSSRNG